MTFIEVITKKVEIYQICGLIENYLIGVLDKFSELHGCCIIALSAVVMLLK